MTDNRPPTVYLVDDDASMLRALSRLLAVTGHAVQTFASATDFLARHLPTTHIRPVQLLPALYGHQLLGRNC
jgi:FixJ family two-component response regulator